MVQYRVGVLENFPWQQPCEDRVAQPAGSEAKGYRYLITVGTGDFTGYNDYLATAKQVNPSDPSHWYFDAPVEGMMVYVKDEDKNYQYITSWDEFVSGSSGSSTYVVKTLMENGHGFSVGDIVRFNGTNYIKAQADSATNSNNVLGLVSKIVDVNNFQLATTGYIDGLSGLTAGYTYFLSAGVAGGLTATEPSAVGAISKPMLIAVAADAGFVFNFRTSPGVIFSLVVRDVDDALTPIEGFAGQLGLFELDSNGALMAINENINDSLLELDANDAIISKG